MKIDIEEIDFPSKKKVAVIVAHPDDETLWAGGAILSHQDRDCFVVSLCRANDEDRAPKFYETLKLLNAKGTMGSLKDGPKQRPIAANTVEQWVLKLLPTEHFDLIITHNPLGEYTKHLRHEDVSKAVINLWNKGAISTDALWIFAYEDGQKAYLPQPCEKANLFIQLPADVWQKKYNIITKTYGFKPKSWEARTTPKGEAFWQFTEAKEAEKWTQNLLIQNKN